MVKPLTPDEILSALKTWGIPHAETSGWRSRANGTGWGDVTGFMVHHTGDDAPDASDLKVVTNGYAGLPGPLCNFGLDDDGKVHLVAAGAANHAGGGDQRVLDAVRQESYDAYPPAPRFTHADRLAGVAGTANGNPVFYGVETFYYRNLTPAARRTMPRLAAAIIWALDRKDTKNRWTAKSVIGHKEWQRGKVDPALVDMAALRREVQGLLDAGPSGAPTQEEDMANVSDAEKKTLLEAAALIKAVVRERYYVMEPDENGKPNLRIVPKGTAGAIKSPLLDTIDGNTLRLTAVEAALDADELKAVVAEVAPTVGEVDAKAIVDAFVARLVTNTTTQES